MFRHVSNEYFKNFCIGWPESHRSLYHDTRRAHLDPQRGGGFGHSVHNRMFHLIENGVDFTTPYIAA
jgi:hypothetical protein